MGRGKGEGMREGGRNGQSRLRKWGEGKVGEEREKILGREAGMGRVG